MFGNFIYFIIVVLIYTTFQPSSETNFPAVVSVPLFAALTLLFAWMTRLQFRRLQARIRQDAFTRLDHRFSAVLTRQSIMAIVLFAVDIYGLNLPSFLARVPLFEAVPTLEAVLFLGLFIGYLSIVWAAAHDVHRIIYASEFSRREYILSHITFSVPILLPWLLLSGVADLIRVLPFSAPRAFLETTQGEVIYFLFFLFSIAVFGPAIIQRFWGCRPLEPGEVRSRIDALCRKAGVEYNDILYWPIFGGKMLTAGVMGLVKRFRYILVTPTLLSVLSPEEIDAVIAHEAGHVKRKHLLFYLLFFGGYMLLSYATFDLIVLLIIYSQPLYRFIIDMGFNQATLMSSLFSLIFIATFVIYFRYVFGFFMRNFERQADTFVYSVSGSAGPLIATFGKIAAASGSPPDKPNWHHFSIFERIAYLKKCEADRRWIGRHDRKVRTSLVLYLAVLLAVGAMGYQLNFGSAGKKLNDRFLEKIIVREIERAPDNADLYSILGDLYYHRSQFDEAVRSYERSLQLSPDTPQVLNNLAWLYATCEDRRLRDPERAIRLAKRAIARDRSPHIWDTLAESYYAGGYYQNAIEAAGQALQSSRKNRAYYDGQLKKFRLALKKSENGI